MDKTLEVYKFIEEYIYKNNYPPTIREICSGVNSSKYCEIFSFFCGITIVCNAEMNFSVQNFDGDMK